MKDWMLGLAFLAVLVAIFTLVLVFVVGVEAPVVLIVGILALCAAIGFTSAFLSMR